MTQQLVEAPPARSAPPRMTYEQFLAFPHENPHVEWVDGETIPMPPISGEHTHVGRFLIHVLTYFVEKRKLGTVYYEPFQMKPSPELPGRAPDLFVVLNTNPAAVRECFLEGPADIAVEIISPDSRTRDRLHKYREYELGGVREYWVIDPQHHRAEFYGPGPNNLYEVIQVSDGAFRSRVLPEFWIRIDWLWNRPSLDDVLKEWSLV